MEEKEKMENKEKVNCCESCGNCSDCKGCGCCHSMHGCCGYGHGFGRHHRIAKKIIFIILLVAAFCFGTAWGEMHSYVRSGRYYGNGYGMMMGWDDFGGRGFNGLNIQQGTPATNNQTSGSATVKVSQ